MIKLLFASFFLLVFYMPASATSEAEFQELYKSAPVLQKADHFLNQTWKDVRANIPKKDEKTLLAFQHEWLKTGRHAAAEEYMQEGYSKACAYAIATVRWAQNLRVMEYNFNLSEKDQGAAKPDDAFFDEDKDIPVECRK